MTLLKVSGFWRMFTVFLLGGIVFTFLTIILAANHLKSGNEIHIGKLKIKNSSHIEVPIILESDPDGDIKQKEKRKRRKKDK